MQWRDTICGASNSGLAIAFGHVTGTSATTSMQSVAVNSNAANGYNVYMRSSGITDGFGHTIPNISGTNSAPGAAPVSGTAGVGYTTDDATLTGGTLNRFTAPSAAWAGLSATGDVVDSSSANTGGSTQTQCVGIQVATANSLPAGSYGGTLIYTAVPTF